MHLINFADYLRIFSQWMQKNRHYCFLNNDNCCLYSIIIIVSFLSYFYLLKLVPIYVFSQICAGHACCGQFNETRCYIGYSDKTSVWGSQITSMDWCLLTTCTWFFINNRICLSITKSTLLAHTTHKGLQGCNMCNQMNFLIFISWKVTSGFDNYFICITGWRRRNCARSFSS